MLKASLKAFLGSRKKSKGSISSFQAFCTSLAQRVGTGNLAGVATAIYSGGEGAIFWMWITAFLGASTAFVESTLAQVYKIKKPDGSILGGPSYYIEKAFSSKIPAKIFSITLILALGLVFNSVQSNTIAQGLYLSFGLPPLTCGLILAFSSALVIFGGFKRIATVSEIFVPIMAIFYLALVFYVMVIHKSELFFLIENIFKKAFCFESCAAGVLGHTVKEAFRYGVARGLFSNEAGFGTAPNAAALATVDHPVKQGLIQMVAVYVDTLLICSATAFLILLSPMDNDLNGIALTQSAALTHFGPIGHYFIAIAVILFGFTTILGNTFYAENNLKYLFKNKKALIYFRLLVFSMVILGAVLSVPTVWEMADMISAIMLFINLSAILLLAKVAKKTLKSYPKSN